MEGYLQKTFNLNSEQISVLSNYQIEDKLVFQDRFLQREILDLLHRLGWQKTINFLDSCGSLTDLIWTQPGYLMPYLSSMIKQEETTKLAKPKTMKSLEPCKRCGSKNIRFAIKQIRAGDEGGSVLVACVNCGLSNRAA